MNNNAVDSLNHNENVLISLNLSKAERRVVSQLMQGLHNREIGDRLGVTEKAVKFQLTNVYRKLGLKSRHELKERLQTLGWTYVLSPNVLYKIVTVPDELDLLPGGFR